MKPRPVFSSPLEKPRRFPARVAAPLISPPARLPLGPLAPLHPHLFAPLRSPDNHHHPFLPSHHPPFYIPHSSDGQSLLVRKPGEKKNSLMLVTEGGCCCCCAMQRSLSSERGGEPPCCAQDQSVRVQTSRQAGTEWEGARLLSAIRITALYSLHEIHHPLSRKRKRDHL